ncbi:MAG: hypothetical protein FMNOHCHN_01296 [Ignavibacteriaceae bacterium]|nr:hypothetical protein [Ignavibacteriaceae bacterium]
MPLRSGAAFFFHEDLPFPIINKRNSPHLSAGVRKTVSWFKKNHYFRKKQLQRMILETLDVKQNDIFIYSENRFDLDDNFRLINKDEKIKKTAGIHFNDVCAFVYDEKPKSLVVYRLLTNFPSFNSSLVKYGIIVNVNGAPEVIYFDPVYALRELDEYYEMQNFPDLRFRIQQVGLISSFRIQGEANFQEVYAFDLEAIEVENQNDRVFAELIFAFEDIDFDRIASFRSTSSGQNVPKQLFTTLNANDFQGQISEESEYSGKQDFTRRNAVPDSELKNETPRMQRVVTVHGDFTPPKNEVKQKFSAPPPPRLVKLGSGSAEAPADSTAGKKPKFSDFLSKVKNETQQGQETEADNQRRVIDLFKSTTGMKDFVVEREKKQVILKLKK